jgi:hypothetical protein
VDGGVADSPGFIELGFVFERDVAILGEAIEEDFDCAAIPWAMAGFLQALATTPLYDRMSKQGRLLDENTALSNFDSPNFRTLLPLPTLLQGLRETLVSLYSASAFYNRAYRSLLQWETREQQKAAPYPFLLALGILVRSVFRQGIASSYRRAYWKFLLQILTRWSRIPPKLVMGMTILLSGHHFIKYAQDVAAALEAQSQKLAAQQPTVTFGPSFGSQGDEGASLSTLSH